MGAEPRVVLGLVIGHSVKVAVIGVAAGLVGAFLASKLLQRLLYGVSPTDAATFAGVPGS